MTAPTPLLAPDEPGPVRLLNPAAPAACLLVCDHAANFIPRSLANLGLGTTELRRHIAWDIGAAAVTERLSALLQATAILSNFSRLVVDPNREPTDPSSMPQVSDRTEVPGNRGLTAAQREQRLATFFRPYHAVLTAEFARRAAAGRITPLVSIHSFTPVMDGFVRPWEIGILWNQDGRLALPMLELLAAAGVPVGDNEPYTGRDNHGYTTHTHADAAGLPNVLIEIRQDLIDSPQGVIKWADILAPILAQCLADPALLTQWQG